jgi:uncharacterized protein (TIGR02246 family)
MLLIATTATVALGQGAEKLAKNKGEQEVLKTLDAVLRAMDEFDLATIERLYTDDYVFTSIAGVSSSRTQLLEGFKRMKANGLAFLAWTPSEMKVAHYGDSAVTNNRYEIKTRNAQGEEKTVTQRYTCMWVKQKGQWRLAAAQATEIKPPAQQ